MADHVAQDARPSDAIYLNLAVAEELTGRGGLDADAARAVMDGRPYDSWADVERLSGLAPDVVSGLQSRGVELGAPSSGPIGEPGSGGSAAAPAGNLGKA